MLVYFSTVLYILPFIPMLKIIKSVKSRSRSTAELLLLAVFGGGLQKLTFDKVHQTLP